MSKQGYLLILIICLVFSFSAIGQTSLDRVRIISIKDEINNCYMVIRSFDWEVRFADNIELWHTRQVSRNEFSQEIYKADSLFLNLQLIKSKIDQDSFSILHKQIHELIDIEYLRYCDTVKPVLIKNISRNTIENLLLGLHDTLYTLEKFKKNDLLPGVSLIRNRHRGNCYSSKITLKVVSIDNDTLTADNDVDYNPMIPWNSNIKSGDLYNPLINWSLNAILPEDMSYNKGKLTKGLIK